MLAGARCRGLPTTTQTLVALRKISEMHLQVSNSNGGNRIVAANIAERELVADCLRVCAASFTVWHSATTRFLSMAGDYWHSCCLKLPCPDRRALTAAPTSSIWPVSLTRRSAKTTWFIFRRL